MDGRVRWVGGWFNLCTPMLDATQSIHPGSASATHANTISRRSSLRPKPTSMVAEQPFGPRVSTWSSVHPLAIFVVPVINALKLPQDPLAVPQLSKQHLPHHQLPLKALAPGLEARVAADGGVYPDSSART